MKAPLQFVDEIAVVDGLVVIRNGKLTPEAKHSPYMQTLLALMADKQKQGESDAEDTAAGSKRSS